MNSAAFTKNEIELGNRITRLEQQLRATEEQRDEVRRRYCAVVAESDERQRRIVELEAENREVCTAKNALISRIRELEAGHAKAKETTQRVFHDIEQTLGKALKYPWYKDDPKNFPDATEVDGVCVGEHVPESLALEAANKIKELEAELAELNRIKDVQVARAIFNDGVKANFRMQELKADNARLRKWLKRIADLTVEGKTAIEFIISEIAREGLEGK